MYFQQNSEWQKCTVQFHVDDLMISHVEMDVVKDVIDSLNQRFGTIKPLSASYGNIHEYLGMQIDLSEDQEVKITMYPYLEDILSEMPSNMDRLSPWPADKDIFVVDENLELLNTEQADFFH